MLCVTDSWRDNVIFLIFFVIGRNVRGRLYVFLIRWNASGIVDFERTFVLILDSLCGRQSSQGEKYGVIEFVLVRQS